MACLYLSRVQQFDLMTYRLLILAGTLILQMHQLYHCRVKRSRKLALLHKVIEMIPVSPSEMIAKFIKDKAKESVEICKGSVRAAEPISSILNPNKKVIYSKLYGYNNFLGVLTKKRLLQIKEPSYMQVQDGQNTVNIYESHRSITVPTQETVLTSINNIIEELKTRFRMLFNHKKDSFFNSYVNYLVGSQKLQENYIPDPSQCAILGKFKQEGAEICCYEPTLISPSKERMIALIHQDLAGDQVQRVVLVFGIVLTLGWLAKQAWQLYQKNRSKTDDFISKLRKIFVKSRICSICNENLSCIINKSCSHMATCRKCWKEGQPCIQCNKKVKEVMEVYVS